MKLFTVGRSSLQRSATQTTALGIKTPPQYQQEASYEALKQEERKKFSRNRNRFNYDSNYTCALALPYSKTTLNSQWHDEAMLLTLCEDHIIEHANRRVDLFFYTLIAYYQTSILPVEGHTDLQHGIGRNIEYKNYGTQACHSSFTPGLLDTTIFQNEKKYKSLLSGTHLLDSLNTTVELPPFVNQFDDILESICRPKCIEILHKVSLGQINPIEGLTAFLKMMDTMLQDFKQQASKEHYATLSYPNLTEHRYVNPRLIDLVIQGTLDTSYNSQSNKANDLYIQLLLRITTEDNTRGQQSIKHQEKMYLEKILIIQSEILESESRVMASFF